MITAKLATSMADIAARCPSERLWDESRYVIVADLRMGDGGKKDELAIAKKALFAILGRYYLPRGYTLVLDGDIEDLRRFWLKDILAAWPEMYALFDAFKEKNRLRKIVGERDLSLLRLRSYPYELSQGLRLDGERNSILVLHGHQASPPFVGRDYLSDYMVHWLGSAKRPKTENVDEDRQGRFKAERRLYRASSYLGIVAIQGHTRRPLFESRTNRDSFHAEVERLLRAGDPRENGSKIDELISIYRKEERRAAARRSLPSGPGYDERGLVSPCLFSPGRIVGAKVQGALGLRMLELEDGFLSLVRWAKAKRGKEGQPLGHTGLGAPAAEPRALEGTPYLRFETRSSSVQGLFERINLFAPMRGEDKKEAGR
jgi:hypothetical protein